MALTGFPQPRPSIGRPSLQGGQRVEPSLPLSMGACVQTLKHHGVAFWQELRCQFEAEPRFCRRSRQAIHKAPPGGRAEMLPAPRAVDSQSASPGDIGRGVVPFARRRFMVAPPRKSSAQLIGAFHLFASTEPLGPRTLMMSNLSSFAGNHGVAAEIMWSRAYAHLLRRAAGVV